LAPTKRDRDSFDDRLRRYLNERAAESARADSDEEYIPGERLQRLRRATLGRRSRGWLLLALGLVSLAALLALTYMSRGT
jgi:hypothetical protein